MFNSRFLALLLIGSGAVFLPPERAAAASELVLKWATRPSASVVVEGIPRAQLQRWEKSPPADWNRFLSVVAEQGNIAVDLHLPSMLGTHEISGNKLVFRPQFPFTPGIRYRAFFHAERIPGTPAGKLMISSDFKIEPPPEKRSTVVHTIYPTSEVVPENLLKFYLHFSASMSRGDIYQYIQLLDSKGKPVELPFLEIDEELWNPDMTRLTLFIDPGRIKRGVQPLEEIGPALEEGKSFVLKISDQWRDGSGSRLAIPGEKKFSVGPADRNPPEPGRWQIKAPARGSRADLTVDFGESLDHALAQRMIQVVDAGKKVVAGSARLSSAERQWHFVPERKWKSGRYQLTVRKTIEDLAGNNIGKRFEVDLFEKVEARFKDEIVSIPFEVR